MNPKEIFVLSLSALNERKIRTLLTVLMVVVGSSLMIVLNGMSAGQTQFLNDQLNQLADNVLTVNPGQNSFRSVDTTPSMVFNSVVKSRISSLPYVEDVVSKYTGSVELNSQARVLRTSIIAMDPEKIYVTVPGLELEPSSVIKPNDPSAILVGHSVANPSGSTFPIVSIGQSVKLTYNYVDNNGQQNSDSRIFIVSGIMQESGDFSLDRAVIINENVGNTFLKKSGKFSSFDVVVQSSDLVNTVQEEIQGLYGTSIGISSLTSRLAFRQSFTEGNNAFILSIGVIALVVGAVGIITTLYTSVSERIKEIGTMKAIGAQNTTILALFLVEASLIGIIGGTAGIVTGIVAGQGLSSIISQPLPGASNIAPVYQGMDLLRIWALSVGLSVLAGILPALKASRLSPLIALRRE